MPPTTFGVFLVWYVLADGQPPVLELRLHHLARGTRVRRAFEHGEHSRMRIASDGLRRRLNESHIRIASLAERRRYGDRDRIAASERALVRRGLEPTGLQHCRDLGRTDVLYVRFAAHEQPAHAVAHVVADDMEASLRELHRER
jgi:hypothetical protein